MQGDRESAAADPDGGVSEAVVAVQRIAAAVRDRVQRVIVGQSQTIELAIAALLARGHVLIEGVPGTGKTTLSKALATALRCDFGRIQFTPDLVPADVLGINFFDMNTREFEFLAGPVFTQILLADEINRATPRTQSALLEAMQERQVTIDGVTRALPTPFFVVATLNPIEMEGTFPLPEAQLDRFLLRLELGYPTTAEEAIMLDRFQGDADPSAAAPVAGPDDIARAQAAVDGVAVDGAVRDYLLAIVGATRNDARLRLGASPRAALALQRASQARAAIDGRGYVMPDDIKALATPALAHRLIVVAIVGAAAGKWFVAALCGLVLAVAFVSRQWARLALVDVDYRCLPSSDRLMVGDIVDLALIVENRKPLPLSWINVFESVPTGLELEREGPPPRGEFGFGMREVRETTSLGPYERVRFRHRLRAMRRGHYAFGPTQIVSGDIFGFYEARLDTPRRPPSVVVYPRTVPLPDFDLLSSRPIGDAWSRSWLVDDPTRPSGLREYRSGDAARRIDWKATARRDAVFVRTYDPSVTQRVVILLDCNTSNPGYWSNRPAVLEAAITGAASVAVRSIELGHAVGLVSNGNTASGLAPPMIAPGAGPDQLAALMTTLAGASALTATHRLEDLVARYGPQAMPFGATVVYVAGVFRPSTAAFVADLGRRGHRIVALYVGEEETPEIPGLPIRDYRAVFAPPENADA